MGVGLPAKKAVHRLVNGHEGYVSATMRNDSLFLLYTSSGDTILDFIREIKLNEFDGIEADLPRIYTQNGKASMRGFFCVNNRLYMLGMRPEVFDLGQQALVYSEFKERANPEWSQYGDIFMYDGDVYRSYGWRDYSKGLDVVREYKVVGHLPLDIEFNAPLADHYLYGFSASRKAFCVYCLKTQVMLLELSLEKYGLSSPIIQRHVFRHKDRLFVLMGPWVLIVDLALHEVVGEFNYVEQEAFQALLASGHLSGDAYAYKISVARDGFAIHNADSWSYMMYVTVSGADMKLAWLVHSRSTVKVANTEGDLLFGIEDYRAKAWDKFTGEQIWQASAGTMASGIQLGDNWVVFTHPSGDLQCYRWKKPYVSPHRPG